MVLFIFLCFCAAIVVVGIFIWQRRDTSKGELEVKVDASDIVPVGKYLFGHPDIDDSSYGINLATTKEDFIIYLGFKKRLGVIPKQSIKSIDVEDRGRVEKRVSAARLVGLGVLALAVPKKTTTDEAYLVIEWGDDKSISHQTVFQMEGINVANKSRNRLLRSL